MNKIVIDKLDLDLYHEVLENGLEVFLVPKNNCKNIYTTLTTKYGSVDLEFEVDGEYKKVPAGIAHFLEHKMFEQEDGIEPFKVFDQNGASANAYTNYNQTTYLFSGPDNFDKNIKMLLDYISNPYFTDENVEKEKGIIIQELKMYQDSPYRRSFEEIVKNSFIENSIKNSVGGTIESVNKITKDDLYLCYNSFYNPSNMFLVITGNINPEETLRLIKENIVQNRNNVEVIKKTYNEPDNVSVKEDTIKMNVAIPKVNYAVKINTKKLGFSKKEIRQYLSIFLDANFGGTSEFIEEVKEKEIINDDVEYMCVPTDKHLLIIFNVETNKIEEIVEGIKRTLKIIPTEEIFNRKKKVFLSSIIYTSDNIFSINNMITSAIINNNEFNPNLYNQIKSLNYVDFVKILNSIDFSNDSILTILPNK